MVQSVANDSSTDSQCFRLKGSLFTLTVLQLLKMDHELFSQQLRQTIHQAPKFFQQAPIVIDLNQFNNHHYPLNLVKLKQQLIEVGLIPVGIRGGDLTIHQQAQPAGLPILANSNQSEVGKTKSTAKSKPKDMESALEAKSIKTQDKSKDALEQSYSTKVINQPVRSGQQIYAKNSDLIVLAAVSHGAEVLADGHIHAYGPLRGRALAGVLGNKNARIFCKSLEAELISIAGHYLINEQLSVYKDIPHLHIYLEGDQLKCVGL